MTQNVRRIQAAWSVKYGTRRSFQTSSSSRQEHIAAQETTSRFPSGLTPAKCFAGLRLPLDFIRRLNCLPPDAAHGVAPWLRQFMGLPLGVYPNNGRYDQWVWE
jgi:hypothetical protein